MGGGTKYPERAKTLPPGPLRASDQFEYFRGLFDKTSNFKNTKYINKLGPKTLNRSRIGNAFPR
jgi:hypothetical protein